MLSKRLFWLSADQWSAIELHILCDVIGKPFALDLTACNVADVKAVPDLLAHLNGARYLIADDGYDADGLHREPATGASPP